MLDKKEWKFDKVVKIYLIRQKKFLTSGNEIDLLFSVLSKKMKHIQPISNPRQFVFPYYYMCVHSEVAYSK